MLDLEIMIHQTHMYFSTIETNTVHAIGQRRHGVREREIYYRLWAWGREKLDVCVHERESCRSRVVANENYLGER